MANQELTRHVLVAAVAAVTGLALAVASMARPPAAFACSADADYDPRAASEIIIGGYIRGWEPRYDLRDAGGLPGFVPVQIDLRVDHAWKRAYDGMAIIDRASYREETVLNTGEVLRRWGSGGACGAFGADPTGMFGVFGLSRDDAGNWRTHLLTMFYFDAAPYSVASVDAYGRALAPPVAGFGGNHGGGATRLPLTLGVLVVGGAAIAVLVVRARRSRRSADA